MSREQTPRNPRLRDALDDLNERMPIDVMPCSNGEFLPEAPTAEQRTIMRLQEEKGEEVRRTLGLSRRAFVRTSAALTVGVWAIDQVTGGKYGGFKSAEARDRTCELSYPGAQMANLPGEFIFDIQSHHVEPDDFWRVRNPGFHAFFTAIWEQSGPLGGTPGMGDGAQIHGTGRGGEIDPIANLSRYHYMKELFLDSSTNMTVLSAVPSAPDDQPLGVDKAAYTVDMVNEIAQSERSVMHAFVMPNRGSAGTTSTSLGRDPVFMQEEFDLMERNALRYGSRLRGWKVYTPWGDVPNFSGWFLDDAIGLKFLAQVRHMGDTFGCPKVVAAHKGFALPAFDQRAASPRDIGPAARQFPDINFIVYHSGFDSEAQGPYPGDDSVNSADRGLNSFIKSLRENGLDQTRFIPPGRMFGNTPNVYAEIGSVWRSNMRKADAAAHMLGKLINAVGPRRVVWGTDSLWYGSPQPEITLFRSFEFTEAGKALYNLPYGLDGDVDDPSRSALTAGNYTTAHSAVAGWPTDGKAHPERSIRNGILGRNAAVPYRVDPDAARHALSCDRAASFREAYVTDPVSEYETRSMAANQLFGFRTGSALMADRAGRPWAP